MLFQNLFCFAIIYVWAFCWFTLKVPRKNVSENVVCWNCLLQIITLHYWRIKYRSKQRGPRTDCSYRSSLIWVYTVYHRGFLNIQQTRKADFFCCDWRIKDYFILYFGAGEKRGSFCLICLLFSLLFLWNCCSMKYIEDLTWVLMFYWIY